MMNVWDGYLFNDTQVDAISIISGDSGWHRAKSQDPMAAELAYSHSF